MKIPRTPAQPGIVFNSIGKVSISLILSLEITFLSFSFHAHAFEFPRGESPFFVGKKLSTSGSFNGRSFKLMFWELHLYNRWE